MTNSESERGDSDKAVDALIALAFKTVEEDELSDANIVQHLSSDAELPPSFQASLDSLGPDLMQRMILAESHVRAEFPDLSAEEFLTAVKEKLKTSVVRSQAEGFTETSTRDFVFQIMPGLKELLRRYALAYGASETQSASRDYVYWTRDKQTKLVFRLSGQGKFTLSVWNATGGLSSRLNDCELLAVGGGTIARIVAGSARVPAKVIESGFAIRTTDRKQLDLMPEP